MFTFLGGNVLETDKEMQIVMAMDHNGSLSMFYHFQLSRWKTLPNYLLDGAFNVFLLLHLEVVLEFPTLASGSNL